ncbi:Nascent polypeptide-associated complex subunit beta [Sorochytrium milnesiophthora]
MNASRLAKLQDNVRIGGKGTPRRKNKRSHKVAAVDDKKIQTALKKLHVQTIAHVEEVNMFKEDGSVIHFSLPKVQASVQSNTFAVYGHAEEKEITEMLPGVLGQLGQQNYAHLQRMIESFGGMNALQGLAGGMGGASSQGKGAEAAGGDDDVPELVENFDETADE